MIFCIKISTWKTPGTTICHTPGSIWLSRIFFVSGEILIISLLLLRFLQCYADCLGNTTAYYTAHGHFQCSVDIPAECHGKCEQDLLLVAFRLSDILDDRNTHCVQALQILGMTETDHQGWT